MKTLTTKKTFALFLFFILFYGCGDKSTPLLAQVGEIGNSTATKGSPSAPVTIVVYSDFQCPACAKAEAIVSEIFKKYKDKIYLIFRYYPLENHRHGFTSAVAAECAREQNRFWDYHQLLFDRQLEWGNNINDISINDPANTFSQYATELGLKVDTFNQCLVSELSKMAVLRSREEGDELRIMSTPTFFINNRRIVGPLSLKATYEAAIKEALKDSKK